MSYPNMSYCMCENTLGALRQVNHALEQEGAQFVTQMNQYERAAFHQLAEACKDFVQLSEYLLEQEEEEEED
jgi:hypothetical protein